MKCPKCNWNLLDWKEDEDDGVMFATCQNCVVVYTEKEMGVILENEKISRTNAK